jgi:ribosomal protein L5
VSTRSFDGRGNYSLGVKEQMIFPEINYDMVELVHGMDITFVTTTDQRRPGVRAAARARDAVPRHRQAPRAAPGSDGRAADGRAAAA